jgi:hypothetical protein
MSLPGEGNIAYDEAALRQRRRLIQNSECQYNLYLCRLEASSNLGFCI